MTMNTVSHLPAASIDSLTPGLRAAYVLWDSGVDLRAVYTKSAFYRFRSRLLVHGIDIAALNPKEKSNVVPLVRVLEAVPAQVPDWAHGTPLYWEPRRVA
jgi:II/X family phage/plasmid replication protein